MITANRIYVPYEIAKPQIKEGDILLFRGGSLAGWLISLYTRSQYSHVEMATWHNGDGLLEAASFGGVAGLGGHINNFSHVLENADGKIDVYRVPSVRLVPRFDPIEQRAYHEKVFFPAKAVTNTMRQMAGRKYNFWVIWKLLKTHIPFMRLFVKTKEWDDGAIANLDEVCSTSVAEAYARHGWDLVHNLANSYTQPADISRSALLSYVFTPYLDEGKVPKDAVNIAGPSGQ